MQQWILIVAIGLGNAPSGQLGAFQNEQQCREAGFRLLTLLAQSEGRNDPLKTDWSFSCKPGVATAGQDG